MGGFFEKIIPYTDLFLYDIKVMDNEKHKKYTGVENDLILENLKKLLKLNLPVWIRIPVIPSVNDSNDDMMKIKSFFEENGYPEKVELLPYHAMGEHKYEALGKNVKKFDVPDEEKMRILSEFFSS